MARRQAVLIAGILVLFGVAARLGPHIPNATPVTAIAFVSSRYVGKRWSILLPGAIVLLSDLAIGFYDWRILASVYGSFVLIGALSWISRRQRTALSVGLPVIGASLLFFLITNAAVWLFSPWYEKTLTGLFYSYTLGLPFLRNMLIGDIVYTSLLFGIFEIATANFYPRAKLLASVYSLDRRS